MAIVRWTPCREFSTVQEKINRLKEEALPKRVTVDIGVT